MRSLWWKYVVSVLLGGVMIWLAFRGEDFSGFGERLRKVDPVPLLGYAVLFTAAHALRVVRWGVLVRALGPIRWRDIFTHPFQGLPDDIFDYSKATIHDDLVKLIPSAMRRLSSFQPAKQMIFLDRMVAGHYGNLREIRARVPVLPTVLRYANELEPSSLTGAVQPQPA